MTIAFRDFGEVYVLALKTGKHIATFTKYKDGVFISYNDLFGLSLEEHRQIHNKMEELHLEASTNAKN